MSTNARASNQVTTDHIVAAFLGLYKTDPCLFIVAIFIPPLALLIGYGCGGQFWINLLLSFGLGMIAIPHAWLVLAMKNARKQRSILVPTASGVSLVPDPAVDVIPPPDVIISEIKPSLSPERIDEAAPASILPAPQSGSSSNIERSPPVQPKVEEDAPAIPESVSRNIIEEDNPVQLLVTEEPVPAAVNLERKPSVLDTVHETDEEVSPAIVEQEASSEELPTPMAPSIVPTESLPAAPLPARENSVATVPSEPVLTLPLEQQGTVPPPTTPAASTLESIPTDPSNLPLPPSRAPTSIKGADRNGSSS